MGRSGQTLEVIGRVKKGSERSFSCGGGLLRMLLTTNRWLPQWTNGIKYLDSVRHTEIHIHPGIK